jgi:ketosteroid isomerase-like protein
MRKTRKFTFPRVRVACFVVLALVGTLRAQAQSAAPTTPTFVEVQSTDERRYQAMYARDFDRLADMLADGLLYTHSSAITDDKAAYIASLKKGNVIYHSTLRDEVLMHQHGDTVVMAGHIVIDATIDGTRRLLNNRFTTTWVLVAGEWKLLTWASTAIPKS